MSRRHSPGAFYGISVVRASPFWSGQAGPRGPERLHSGLSREASDSLVPRLPIGGSGHWRPEARALHDGSGGGVSEAVQRAVGEDGLLEAGHPFVRRAVTRIATLLKSSRTRARSKLTGSHTICSKVAASSKPACSSRCSPRKKSWRTQGIRRSTFGFPPPPRTPTGAARSDAASCRESARPERPASPRPEPAGPSAAQRAPRPPDVGRPDRRDHRGGRERATRAQARGHAGRDVLEAARHLPDFDHPQLPIGHGHLPHRREPQPGSTPDARWAKSFGRNCWGNTSGNQAIN